MEVNLRRLYLGLLITVQVFGVGFAQGSHKNDFEHLLMRDLFEDYNKDSRPVFNKSRAVDVQLDVAFSQLVELDGKDQILSSKIWIRQKWDNPFLSWKPENYNGIKVINVDPKLVWKPDLVLYNNIGIGQTGAIYNFDTKVVIEHNGKQSWYAPTEIKSICKIDITYFPFDEQKCPLIFGSWTYTGTHLNLSNKAPTADLSKYTVSGEWELIAVPATRNVVKYSCCPDPYIDVTYTVHVRRKVLFYLTNLILPCVVLGVLTVFSFSLPPESGERISLVITILLGLTVFMLVFTENVPRTSEVIPLIVKYAFTVMCEVSFSLLITCLVVRIYHKDPAKPMPAFYRYIIYRILAPILMMHPMPAGKQDRHLCKQHLERTKDSKYRRSKPYVYISKLFGSYPKESSCKMEMERHGDEITDISSGISRQSDTMKCPSLDKLEDISYGMRAIIDYLKDIKASEFNRNDWHFAARVMDTFFFWVMAVSFAISTTIFYFTIP